MMEEIVYFNHMVVLIGPNHLAINNALGQVLKLYPGMLGSTIKVGQPYNAPDIVISKKWRRI